MRRVVKARCDKRRADVVGEGSSEAQNTSERAIQEDAWIEVVDEDDRVLADRKDRVVGVAGESAAAESARGAMMHSQAERARAQSNVIQPRSRTPARNAKQTSGLTTDQEDISTEAEDEEGEEDTESRHNGEEGGDEGFTISDDDDPFDFTKTSKRPAVPSRGASSSRGDSRSRGRSSKR